MNTLPDSGSLPGTALETLGATLDKDYGRDAIHLATIAVVAAERLFASQHIGLLPDKTASAKVDTIGIVDPFLARFVEPGERFWLVIYPRTITSLRHVWTHPAFADEATAPSATAATDKKAEAEAWLRRFIKSADCPDYDTMMKVFRDESIDDVSDYPPSYRWDDEYLHFTGLDAHGDIPPEFWGHVETLIGKPMRSKPQYFSCSC